MSTRIEVPDRFRIKFVDTLKREKTLDVANAHPGYVVVPERFRGLDYSTYWEADRPPDPRANGEGPKAADHPWLKQWKWAKELIIEWGLKDFPTNPNQIDDEKVPFHLVNYLSKAVYQELHEYTVRRVEELRDQIVMPAVDTITAGEFFAWYRKMEEVKREGLAPAIESFVPNTALVREWPAGSSYPGSGDWRLEDMGIIQAIGDRGNDVILPALDLGNLPEPPGEPYTMRE